MNDNWLENLNKPMTERGVYMIERFSKISNLIRPSKIQTIFEIGSWHLIDALNLAYIFQDSIVHAFEPVPENIEMCKHNLTVPPEDITSRVHLHEIAANDVTGLMDFYPLDLENQKGDNFGMSSKFKLIDPDFYENQHNIQRKITVQGYRLDEWCKENNIDSIDLIWMDAQGSELHVLQGLGDMLENTQFIMTEVGIKEYYHGHTLKPEIDEYLKSKGFFEHVAFRRPSHEYEIDTIYFKSKI